VTGTTEWHVNADEPIALDYNLELKSANHQTTLYDPGPYRSSDHDPLVVGLNLSTSLRDTSPARLHLGLKNNDDGGTHFDVRVVLRVNDGIVALRDRNHEEPCEREGGHGALRTRGPERAPATRSPSKCSPASARTRTAPDAAATATRRGSACITTR
jgi:hypothetical protein